MNRRTAPSRRGLTFIEVVVATGILAGLATMIVGTLSFMENATLRQKHRLNATEVAHRVICQFLDDPDKLPDKNLPIQQGEHLYRFILRDEILVTEDSGTEGLRQGQGRNVTQMDPQEQLRSMLGRVTVQVYLDEPDNPIATDAPMAELVRVYGTLSLADEDAIMKRLLELVGRIQNPPAKSKKSDTGSGSNR